MEMKIPKRPHSGPDQMEPPAKQSRSDDVSKRQREHMHGDSPPDAKRRKSTFTTDEVDWITGPTLEDMGLGIKRTK